MTLEDRLRDALRLAEDAIDALSTDRGGPDESGAEDYDIEAMRERLAALTEAEA